VASTWFRIRRQPRPAHADGAYRRRLLVVEDLFTVVALVLLPAVFGRGGGGASHLAVALLLTLLKVAALVAFTVLVGNRVIPWLLDRVAATRSRELFTLAVLTLALGIAVGSAVVFGVSMALGAFLAGMVVGRSDYSLRAASDALPMRDAFAVLFFVSVGMLLDPRALVDHAGLVVATLGVVMIGKPLIALALVRVLGYPFKVAVSVAIALAQIGEFSFILSTIGRDLGLLTAEASNALWRLDHPIVCNPLPTGGRDDRFSRGPALGHRHGSAGAGRTGDTVARRIPTSRGGVSAGRTVTRSLRMTTPIVVELNIESVRELREGYRAVRRRDEARRRRRLGASARLS
jgi:CPA2 family monovalent cation:H+ antiporter-2